MKEHTDPHQPSVDEIRAQAEMTKNRVKRTAQELVERLRGGSRDKVEESKQAAGGHFSTAGVAVRDAVVRLRSDDQDFVAKPLSQLADSVGQFGLFLQSTSPEELAAKGAETVRRHPVASFGAVFLAGMAVARVIRASH